MKNSLQRPLRQPLVSLVVATLALTASMTVSLTAVAFEGETTSTKDHGVVSVLPDPGLSGGRLLIKVVAQNKSSAATELSSDNIKVFTAAGKPVALVPLQQLIKEVTAAAKPARRGDNQLSMHQQADYSHDDNAALRDTSGNVVQGNYGGAAAATIPSVSSRSDSGAASGVLDAQSQQQVDGLKAGILQSVALAPGQAGGGQIVTERLKFTARESRALKLLVTFNGEQHEFDFAVPPEL